MTLVVRDAVELHVVHYVVERGRGVAAAIVVAVDATRLGNVRYPLRRHLRRDLRLLIKDKLIKDK